MTKPSLESRWRSGEVKRGAGCMVPCALTAVKAGQAIVCRFDQGLGEARTAFV